MTIWTILSCAVMVWSGDDERGIAGRSETLNEVEISFEITAQWEQGFSGTVHITNHARWILWDWTLAFDWPHQIETIWDAAILSHEESHYVLGAIEVEWEDGDIFPGETVSFGFNGAASGEIGLPRRAFLSGTRVVLDGRSPAPPRLEPLEPPTWPDHVFAPFVDATAFPPFDLIGVAQSESVDFFALGFIVADVSGACVPSWGGYHSIESGFLLPEINALRELGKDVVVSFGGASNIPLAAACESVDALAASYLKVVRAYRLSHVDFDVEGFWVADPPSIQRRSAAMRILQEEVLRRGRDLRLWLTLPVLPTGLTPEGVDVVRSAIDHDVDLAGVNIMAMDYGDGAAPDPDGRMGEYAIEAATELFGQLRGLYDDAGISKSDTELWSMVGITPMIGLNDVTTEIFYLSDAAEVLAFGLEKNVGWLSFWSGNRDRQCPEGELPYVRTDCSSILQDPFAFTRLFVPFTH